MFELFLCNFGGHSFGSVEKLIAYVNDISFGFLNKLLICRRLRKLFLGKWYRAKIVLSLFGDDEKSFAFIVKAADFDPEKIHLS